LPFRKTVAVFLVTQLIFMVAQAEGQAPAAPAQVPATQAQTPPVPAAPGQTPAAPAQTPIAPLPTVQDLKILTLEGERSVNNTSRHIGIQPVVEVRDENDRPVEGATVVFRLPVSGPGGSFPGKSPTFSAATNAQGQAAASGFVPNDELGRFDIHVTATYQNRTGETTISQTNSPNSLSLLGKEARKKPLWRNKYVLIGAGVGIAVGIVLILTLGGNSKQPVTITPGPVIINQ
jgi:hypothetical protein